MMAISSIPVLLLPLLRPAQVVFTLSLSLSCCYTHHDLQDKLPCAICTTVYTCLSGLLCADSLGCAHAAHVMLM